MTPKTELHQLVQALTKSEKRYFNLFAKRHIIGPENNYIKLFKIIEEQKVYDENAIKHAYKKPGSKINLAAEKIQLKELILKSLRQFHEKKNLESILYDNLVKIEILYDKGLYQIGYNLTTKSIEQAKKYQKHQHHINLLNWKTLFDLKSGNWEHVFENIQEVKKISDVFDEHIEYMNINFTIISTYAHIGKKGADKLISGLLSKYKSIEKNRAPNSILGNYYFYSSLGLLGDFESNKVKTLTNFEKSLDVFKKNHFFLIEKPNLYLVASNNYIVSLIENKEFVKAEIELLYLKTTTNKITLTDQLKARAFLIFSDNQLLLIQKQNQTSFATNIIKEIEKGIIVHENFIDPNRRIDIYFSLANVNFTNGDYKQTNKFLNKIIKSASQFEVSDYIVEFTEAMQLLVMVESRDLYLFKNKSAKLKRTIERSSQNPWLLELIELLNLLSAKKRSTSLKIKTSINHLLETATLNTGIKRMSDYFEVLKWLTKQ